VIPLFLFLLLAAALAAYAFWIYERAELRVRGTRRLAALRAFSLVLLLALLFDPAVPGLGPHSETRWALLDVSLSMGAGGGQAFQEARRRADELASQGWLVVPLDGSPWPPSAAGSGASSLGSELAPSLRRAAEAGVASVRVLSDLRFEDPEAVRTALGALTAEVRMEAFGGAVNNAGVAAFEVADQVLRSDSVTARVEVFGEGADSIEVEIYEEDRRVASRSLPAPAPGLRQSVTLRLPPSSEAGRRRYAARVKVVRDGFESDDLGVAYMTAGREEGGLVVVSLRPDWEPRSLMTVLAEATGLEASGYLRVGPDRFAPMGSALRRGPPVDSATVRGAVADATLLVLHGLDARTDAWGRSLSRLGGRTLIWPADAVGAELAATPSDPPRSGEWYASSELPASPLAADLAGAVLQGLPPLSSVLPLGEDWRGSAPVLLQLRGTGPPEAGLVLSAGEGRRAAVVLASGYWRWWAREGMARDVYRRLWSGVAGWLLAEDAGGGWGAPRPRRWVVPRGQPVMWRVPGGEGDSIRVRIGPDSAAAFDGVLRGGGSSTTGPLAPGTYEYRAWGPDGREHRGRFDVEARTLEMLPVPRAPAAEAGPDGGAIARGAGGGPLRTTPWPYLLLLTALCAEWIGRRRVGLR
jgi:hypothetical protein